MGVHLLDALLYPGQHLVLGKPVGGSQLGVGIDQGAESAVVLYHEGLDYVGHIVDLALYLLGIDVLSGRTENHALAAALDEQESVGVNHTHVSGTEPAVFGKCLGSSLFVLVIAQEDVVALDQNLTGHVLGIGRIYHNLHPRGSLAAGVEFGLVPAGVCDDGAALCHAVAHGESESDTAEECLGLAVEGCTSDNHLVELAAEGLVELVVDLLEYLLVNDGKPEQQADVPAVDDRLELLLVNLLDDQRYGDDKVGLDGAHGVEDDLGGRESGEEMHVAAGAELHQELEHHTVHVGGREHGHAVGGIVQMAVHLEAEKDVREQGTVRQHDPFGESGSPGGIVDHGQLLGGVLVVIYTIRMEAPGIFLAKELVEVLPGMGYLLIGSVEQGKIVHQDDGVEAGHLRLGETFPHHVTHKEDAGFGVVHQMIDVSALELVQQGNGHGSVGQGGQE